MNPVSTREYGIDAYRVFLMFGIVLLHSCGVVCGHPTTWLAHLFMPCVPGFVLISGWFGLSFKPLKVFKLYALALYAVVVVQLIRMWTGESFDHRMMFDMWRSYWFLNAYVVLLFVVGLLNKCVASESKLGIGAFLFLVFGWGWLVTIPIIKDYVPASSGVEACSSLMMAGVYVVGRLMRIGKIKPFLNGYINGVVIGVSVLAVGIGFCWYTSPFSLVIAMAGFFLFKNSYFVQKMGKYLAWISPSCFTVYLLHSRGTFGFPVMSSLEESLIGAGLNIYIVYLLTAIITFGVCVFLDVPRRVVGGLVHVIIHNYTKSKDVGR